MEPRPPPSRASCRRRPELAPQLVAKLATGRYDALAGRCLHAEHDDLGDLDDLLTRIGDVREHDLNAIRLRRIVASWLVQAKQSVIENIIHTVYKRETWLNEVEDGEEILACTQRRSRRYRRAVSGR